MLSHTHVRSISLDVTPPPLTPILILTLTTNLGIPAPPKGALRGALQLLHAAPVSPPPVQLHCTGAAFTNVARWPLINPYGIHLIVTYYPTHPNPNHNPNPTHDHNHKPLPNPSRNHETPYKSHIWQ